MTNNRIFMRKFVSFLPMISILLLIIDISLFIMWWSSIKHYRNLEYQIEERNELIRSFYCDNFVLDRKSIKLLDSLCLNDSVISTSILPQKIKDSELRIIHNIMQNYLNIIEKSQFTRLCRAICGKC